MKSRAHLRSSRHAARRLRCLFALIMSLTVWNLSAQPTGSFQLLTRITGDIEDFTTDNLGNVYLVSSRQQLKKLDNHFDSVGVYNDVRRNGKLFQVDASNPLKVLLYYKEFATIVVLDRLLNTRNTIDLKLANIFQPGALCQSYDNNIWLFDELDYTIKKMDESGKQLMESSDFRMLFEAPPKPERLEDFNTYLFAYDSSKGLCIFDYYGTLKNQVALRGLRDVQGFSKGIVARTASSLLYYQPSAIETTAQTLPDRIAKSIKVRISGQQLFALVAKGLIEVYRLP